MPRMTAKYSRALDTYNNMPKELNDLTHQETLYEYLESQGWYWDSGRKIWEYYEADEAEEPTPLIKIRVWADGEVIEEAVEDIMTALKKAKLPWTLTERSRVYGCRPPKQKEGRVYLNYLPGGVR